MERPNRMFIHIVQLNAERLRVQIGCLKISPIMLARTLKIDFTLLFAELRAFETTLNEVLGFNKSYQFISSQSELVRGFHTHRISEF